MTLATLLATSALLAADPAGVAKDESPETLIAALADRDYATRERATDALTAARETALEAVAAAALDDDLERAGRAVAILERWAFVGDPSDLSERADRALFDLSTGEHRQAVALAWAALVRHRELREKRAVEQIRKLGGRVEYGGPGFYPRQLMGRPGIILGGARQTDQNAIRQIKLTRDWTGGVEGLYHLKRLQHGTPFRLHIEGKPPETPLPAISALAAVLDGVTIDMTSRASLGIQGSPSTPLRVNEVTPRGACDLAGVRSGDIIRKMGGSDVRSLPHVKELLKNYEPGDRVTLTIDRGGVPIELPVTLQDWTQNDKVSVP